MPFSHNYNQFKSGCKNKQDFIFFKKIIKFENDPIPEFIRIVEKYRYSFLYESVEKGKDKGRYTICGFQSIKSLILNNKTLKIRNLKKEKIITNLKNPLTKVDEIIKSHKFNKIKYLPPMVGSFFGYLSYENIHNIENIRLLIKNNKLKTPDIILFIPKNLIIYDNITKSLFISRHIIKENIENNDYNKITDEFNQIEVNLRKTYKKEKFNFKLRKKIKIKSNTKKSIFIKNIKKIKSYIKEGDIFQAVPSQRFEMNFDGNASSLYKVLRKTNPSPFMYYFNFPKFQIVGSSPEILVRLRSNIITVRPIAGTRPRGRNKKEDKKNEKDLLADKKEIAEHLMLLDLGRNDVGKVSKRSSVKVTAKFVIEKYSHVMHIVSNVTGKIKHKISPIEALMAGFPAGTVSGAPKIRAMQIIDEIESDKRGIYSGGIGYISPIGDMDTCIVLRTGIIINNKLYVQAGGGVVYDSDPQLEYLETVNKAKAVLDAAAIVLGNSNDSIN